MAVQIEGELDSSAFYEAFAAAAASHGALMVTFGLDGQDPVARFYTKPTPYQLVDLSSQPARSARSEAIAELRRWASEPFVLNAAPPIRAGLLKITPSESVFRLEVDHIACDQHSVEVLLGDIARNYTAHRLGDVSAHEGPADGWTRYIELECEAVASGRLGLSLREWERFLNQGEAIPRLPFGRQGTPAPDTDAAPSSSMRIPLPLSLLQGLRNCARTLSVTPFSLVLGLTLFTIAKVGGSSRVGLLSSASTRGTEFENTVGLFSNPLPVFTDVKPRETLPSFLRRAAATFSELHSHAWVPYPHLLYHFNPEDPICVPRIPRLSLRVESEASAQEFLDLPGTTTRTSAMYPDVIFPGNLFFTVHYGESAGTLEAIFDTTAFDYGTISDLLNNFLEVAKNCAAIFA